MCRFVVFSAMLFGVGVGVAAAADGDAPPWKAGFAKVNITPQQPLHLAGYASRNKPSEGVESDIYLGALALDDGQGGRAVLVTADLIGFRAEFAEPMCEAIARRTGLRREQILLNASHTHSAPLLSLNDQPRGALSADDARATVAYTRRIMQQAEEAVAAALDDLSPARLSWGVGVASFVMNRREFTATGVRIGVNPRGLADRSVPVLRIESPEGKLRGVVFGCACHNTTLTGQFYLISGDYAGYAQRHIEEQHPGAVALFVLGCGGDANPYPRSDVALARLHGTHLGEEVCRVLGSSLSRVRGPLVTRLQYVDLPLRVPRSAAELDEWLQSSNPYHRDAARAQQERLQRGETLQDHYRAPMALWRLGNDLTLLGISGETVVDYVPAALEILSPHKAWIAGYCNDVFGYLPSARVLREGGYETRGVYYGAVGIFAPQVEQAVLQAVRDLAHAAGIAKGD
jgi:neutral ceramidase